MEFALLVILVLLLFVLVGTGAYRIIDERQRHRKTACIVYIMRVDSSGKIELKRSPEQLWHWKF